MSDMPPPPNPSGTPTPSEPIPSTPAPGAVAAVPLTADPADVEKNKVMAVLAYIGLLFLVPLLAAKESPFARYHTNQGLILFLTGIILPIACFVIGAILLFIPVVGWILGCLLDVVGACWGIAWLVLAIMGIINAANGQMKPLPLIGGWFTIIK